MRKQVLDRRLKVKELFDEMYCPKETTKASVAREIASPLNWSVYTIEQDIIHIGFQENATKALAAIKSPATKE